MPNIYCLIMSGNGLTDEIRNYLLGTAQKMLRKGKKRLIIREDWCDGLVTTKFKNVCFGAISGVVFQAEIEASEFKTKVVFVVRPGEIPIEEVVWNEGMPYEPGLN